MRFLRVVLLVISVVAFSAAGKSATPQNSAAKQAAQKDDIPKSIAESVSGPLQFVEGNFLGVAEAMPEDKYSFIPTTGKFDDARTFGEQVKHVACAQFAFFNEFEGKKPPDDCEKGGHDPAKTKAELIKYLKDSFDYSNRVVATLTATKRARPGGRSLRRAEYQDRHLRNFRVAHYRSLRTNRRVSALERHCATVYAEIRHQGAVTSAIPTPR